MLEEKTQANQQQDKFCESNMYTGVIRVHKKNKKLKKVFSEKVEQGRQKKKGTSRGTQQGSRIEVQTNELVGFTIKFSLYTVFLTHSPSDGYN